MSGIRGGGGGGGKGRRRGDDVVVRNCPTTALAEELVAFLVGCES